MAQKFFRIDPKVGKPVGIKILRKDGIRYQYRDINTHKFVSCKIFTERERAYKASLQRKDKRKLMLTDRANGEYTAYERQLIKLVANAELCGVWVPTDSYEKRGK